MTLAPPLPLSLRSYPLENGCACRASYQFIILRDPLFHVKSGVTKSVISRRAGKPFHFNRDRNRNVGRTLSRRSVRCEGHRSGRSFGRSAGQSRALAIYRHLRSDKATEFVTPRNFIPRGINFDLSSAADLIGSGAPASVSLNYEPADRTAHEAVPISRTRCASLSRGRPDSSDSR